MGGGGAAPLAGATPGTSSIERQPLGPVATQLKKVVKVGEAACFERFDQFRKHVIGRKGSNHDETILYPKLFVRKIVSVVDSLTTQTGVFERGLPDEDY